MRKAMLLFLVMSLGGPFPGRGDDSSAERARRVHTRALVVDTDDDTPQRMVFQGFDLGARDPRGHVDIPRMREGGLDAVFFSIWVPSKVTGPLAVERSLSRSMPCTSRCGAIPPTCASPPPPRRSGPRWEKGRSPSSWAWRVAT